jgi:hypothetical protein
MRTFKSPMINLYSRDLPRSMSFYSELGFVETFRTPASGEPVHIELRLDGFTLGIATVEAAKEHHSLRPDGEGRWIKIVLWTDDTDTTVNALVAKGAPLLSPPHDFVEGKLAPRGLLIRTATPSKSFSGRARSVRPRAETQRSRQRYCFPA